MAKINLRSNEMSSRKPNSQSSNRSLVLGISTLALGLAAFGLVKYLGIETEAKSQEIRSEITQVEDQMNTAEVKKLYDFQDRLIEIEGLMDRKTMQSVVLNKIARYTLPTTKFKVLGFENQTGKTAIAASVIVENHNELAKQMEAFSLIGDDVDTVLLDSSKVDKEGTGIEGLIGFYMKEEAK